MQNIDPNIQVVLIYEENIKALSNECSIMLKKKRVALSKLITYEINNIYKLRNSLWTYGGGYKSLILACIEYKNKDKVYQYSCICKKDNYGDTIIRICELQEENSNFKIYDKSVIILSSLVFARILTAFLMSLSEMFIRNKKSYFYFNSIQDIKFYDNGLYCSSKNPNEI